MDLGKSMDAIVYTVRLQKFLVISCYYGAKPYFNTAYFQALLGGDFLLNLLYNVGYLYIDVTMLVTGAFTPLESDLYYYMSFYGIDAVGRLLFRDGTTENCWFTWSGCSAVID